MSQTVCARLLNMHIETVLNFDKARTLSLHARYSPNSTQTVDNFTQTSHTEFHSMLKWASETNIYACNLKHGCLALYAHSKFPIRFSFESFVLCIRRIRLVSMVTNHQYRSDEKPLWTKLAAAKVHFSILIHNFIQILQSLMTKMLELLQWYQRPMKMPNRFVFPGQSYT